MEINTKNPLLVSPDLKGGSVDGKSRDIICEAFEARASRRWKVRVMMTRKRARTRRSILMKRRECPDGLRRPRNGVVEKKVRILKKLIPNTSEANGLDGLFRETADYILSLQMRVKVMQILAKALSTTTTTTGF